MRLTIKTLLGSLFGVIFVVVVGIAVQSTLALNALDLRLSQLVEKRAHALSVLGRMNNDTGDVRDAESRIVFGPREQREKAMNDLLLSRGRVNVGQEKYAPTMVDE